MVLVDTSLWIEHLRHGVTTLATLLEDGRVASHPSVIGELACGTLHRRATTLDLMRRLPRALVATDDEALHVLERDRLLGRGLGWTDVHLLAAAALSHFQLWTADRRLHVAARRLRLAFSP